MNYFRNVEAQIIQNARVVRGQAVRWHRGQLELFMRGQVRTGTMNVTLRGEDRTITFPAELSWSRQTGSQATVVSVRPPADLDLCQLTEGRSSAA